MNLPRNAKWSSATQTHSGSESDKVKTYEGHQCGECGEVHKYRSDALNCCPPQVSEVETHQCSICLACHDDYDAAVECADSHAGNGTPHIDHALLEAHGQQRLPL